MSDDVVGLRHKVWARADRALLVTALGAFIASGALYVVAATRYGHDENSTGRSTALAVAGILLSGAVVSVLVGWFTRRVNKAARNREFRRGLIRETLEVHALVKGAAIRVTTYRSVKAYSEAMRDLIIPARARLGGVVSEIRYGLNPGKDGVLAVSMGKCLTFLDDLVNEFSERYLVASRLQEQAERDRKDALTANFRTVGLDELIESGGTYNDFLSSYPWLAVESTAWHVLNGKAWYPELGKLADHKKAGGGYETHFSKPLDTMLAELDP